MSPERVREFVERKPFVPLTVHTSDGREMRIATREMAFFSPSGRTMFVFTGKMIGDDDEMAIIDTFLISTMVTASGDARPDNLKETTKRG